MTRIRSFKTLGVLIAVTGLLAVACGQSDPTPAPTATSVPTQTPRPGASPGPTATARPGPTATARPGPTATARPGASPAPTATAKPAPTATTAPELTPDARLGGVIRQYGRRDPRTFDAHNATSSNDNRFTAKLYNSLLWNPGGDAIECDTCSSFQLEDGGTTLVFELIRGIKFHDGRELNAEDVRYSIRKMMGLVDGRVATRPGFLTQYIDTIEVRDDYTVAIKLIRPSAIVPKLLALPHAAIYKEGTTAEEASKEPKGSGAFILKDRVIGSSLTMERNSQYFKPERPLADGIQFTYIRSKSAGAAAFLTNKLDIYLEFDLFPPDLHASAMQLVAEGKVVHPGTYGGVSPNGLVFNTRRAPFNDIRVRRAIHLAIDREGLCQVAYNGACSPVLVFGTGSAFARPLEEIQKLPGFRRPKDQDISEARGLLALAGFTKDAKVDFLSFSGNETVSEFLTEELRKLGIDAKIALQDNATFNANLDKGDFEVAFLGWGHGVGDPDELIGNALLTTGARNLSGVSDERIDRLFIQQSTELDFQKRVALAREVEDIFLELVPVAPTIEPIAGLYWWSYLHFTPGLTRHIQERLENTWIER